MSRLPSKNYETFPFCTVDYRYLYFQYYRYRAAAFSGVRSFSGVATGGNRVCSVIACTGDTLDTCGRRFTEYAANRTAVFEELSITGTMPTAIRDPELETDGFVVYPVSSKTTIMPLEPSDYTHSTSTSSNVTVHTFILNNPSVDLYSFALWGRVFATDGEEATPPVPSEPNTPGSSTVFVLSSSLLTSALILLGQHYL